MPAEILQAVCERDLGRVQSLLASPEVNVYVEDHQGRSVLTLAALNGDESMVEVLLEAGAAWNAVDSQGKTPAEHAREHGHENIYSKLLEHGIRCELLLGVLESRRREQEEQEGEVSNEQYLNSKLSVTQDKILDEGGDAVMMSWETPLMRRHVDHFQVADRDVLNVGFGMGIFDRFVQERSPRSHTIIEAHPDVYAQMLADGWDDIPGVDVRFGRWQDIVPQLIQEGRQFDCVYFDTFGEYYEDMRDFHEFLLDLVRPGGQYSFFNGLAAKNPFFHQVYCGIVELELKDLCFQVEWDRIPIDPEEQEWEGVKRKYWTLTEYNLCVATLSST
jgi:protein arginine N-methyltransferase 2